MATTTSLESQLIRGAGAAVSKDPHGRVLAAQERAGKQLTEGIKGIGTALAAKKKERDDKIEKQTKQYDAAWRKITDEMEKNLGGLDVSYWQKANDYVTSTLKPVYDACATGEEGRTCRTEARIKLNQFVTETAGAKDALNALNNRQKKMDGTGPTGEKELVKSNSQTFDDRAILGQLTGENASLIGRNDGEIAELETQLEHLEGKKGYVLQSKLSKEDLKEEREKMREKIAALKNNNPVEYGWDISYENEDGETISKRVTKDMLPDLLPHQAKEITTGLKTQTDEAKVQAENLKTGAKGAKKFDLEKSAVAYEDLVTPKNIKSVYKDPLYGGKETLEDHLRQNPVVTGLKYSDLGIDVAADKDGDNVIDPEEWAAINKLNPEDVDKVINALSEPGNEDIGATVAGDYMAKKTERAVNIDLYGDEYYPEPTGPISKVTGRSTYTDEDRTLDLGDGEGSKVYPTIQALREAIETDKTTPRQNADGTWENTTKFENRGGIVGLMKSDEVYQTVETPVGIGVVKRKLVPTKKTKVEKTEFDPNAYTK